MFIEEYHSSKGISSSMKAVNVGVGFEFRVKI